MLLYSSSLEKKTSLESIYNFFSEKIMFHSLKSYK